MPSRRNLAILFAPSAPRRYNRREAVNAMPKSIVLLLVLSSTSLLTTAQTSQKLPKEPYPSMNTLGDTDPASVSDLNAQIIWLMAVSPAPADTAEVTMARSAYQRAGLGKLGATDQAKLTSILADFRKRHDAFAADYNTLVPSIGRDDVWHEYRDFRIKVNDLVEETMRAINDALPGNAAQLHTTIEEQKRSINLTTYKSSADAAYASNPRTAATGFAMIEGTVTNANRDGDRRSALAYATAVIVGMVPGCPGKVVPVVLPVSGGAPVNGPATHPWEYVNFQYTTRPTGPGIGIMVNCEMTVR